MGKHKRDCDCVEETAARETRRGERERTINEKRREERRRRRETRESTRRREAASARLHRRVACGAASHGFPHSGILAHQHCGVQILDSYTRTSIHVRKYEMRQSAGSDASGLAELRRVLNANPDLRGISFSAAPGSNFGECIIGAMDLPA